MPYLCRTFSPRELAGSLVNRSWLEPHVRLSLVDLRGFVWNPIAGYLPDVPDDHRTYVHWLVAGRGHVLASGATLGAGDALVARSFHASLAEDRLAVIGDHQAIAVRLDAATPGGGVLRLSRERARSFYEALSRARTEAEAARVSRDMLALLAAHGVVSGAVQPSLAARASDTTLAASLTQALTFVASRPALCDFRSREFAPTERQLQRQVRDFFTRFRMPFAGWRDMRQSFCLTTAALAMTLPGARTDRVASATGFASASSLCHALQRVGMATPQELSAAARRLTRAL